MTETHHTKLENSSIFAIIPPMSLADDLVTKGVLKSPRIIQAFRDTNRADFMPEDERSLAEIDEPFPIGEGQTISQPYTVAFMLELLGPKPGQHILDVGFGSGWQSALLAHIVSDNKKTSGRVFAIERLQKLCDFGKTNIAKYNYITSGVVETYCCDAVVELDNVAKVAGGFDGIIAAAAAPAKQDSIESSIPRAWKKHLKPGGKIIMPIGESLWVFTKKKSNELDGKEYPGFLFVPLVSSQKKKKKQQNQPFWNRISKSPLFFVCAATALLVSSFAGVAVFLASPPPNIAFPKEVTIPRSSSARVSAEFLEQEGVVRSSYFILFSLLASGDIRNIQAGTYFFDKPRWVFSIAKSITNPLTRKILTLRIPEGSTLRGVASEYENQNLFMGEELWTLTGIPAHDYRDGEPILPDFSELKNQFSFLQELPSYATLEGFLLPDTYELFDDVEPAEVVYKMLQNFETRMQEEGLFEEIKKQELSLYEVVTLASLLEREAIHYNDKRIIAGIIENRLKRDMPLQLDASLMYVTGRGSLLLTKEDLDSGSPYNTYEHKGLPLGPIANPGIDSIKAVLNPEKTSYLYYLSDRHYTIYYSKTFEEHKQKKQIYLQ